MAFMCFILYAWQISGLQVDFLVVAAFSTVPLAAGLLGFVGAMGKKRGDVLGAVNVFSLFAFNMLMVAYLVLVSVYPCV